MRGGDMAERVDHGKHRQTGHPGGSHQAMIRAGKSADSRQRNRRKDNAEGADEFCSIAPKHTV